MERGPEQEGKGLKGFKDGSIRILVATDVAPGALTSKTWTWSSISTFRTTTTPTSIASDVLGGLERKAWRYRSSCQRRCN